MRLKDPDMDLPRLRDTDLPKDPDLWLSVLAALTRSMSLGELGSALLWSHNLLHTRGYVPQKIPKEGTP